MFACPAQFGTRLLANLICIALLKKASSPGRKKNQDREKFLYKKYLWGSFLPLPPVLLLTNPLSHGHCCRARLHYTPACGTTRDRTWTRKQSLLILISTSPQDMVWTGKFCPVKLSNITNYSVQALIETTPWKSDGSWCAAVWQSRTVATTQQFPSHESCRSEFNLSNQPLYIASRTNLLPPWNLCSWVCLPRLPAFNVCLGQSQQKLL